MGDPLEVKGLMINLIYVKDLKIFFKGGGGGGGGREQCLNYLHVVCPFVDLISLTAVYHDHVF